MALKTLAVTVAFVMTATTNSLAQTASTAALVLTPADAIVAALNAAPEREGPAPETPDGIPHQQHSQNAPPEMVEALTAAASSLPGIVLAPTPFSLVGSLGWQLEPGLATGPDDAFISGSQEFGHQHRVSDGSMHMLLPSELSAIALGKGWGIIHPIDSQISGESSSYVMIYGPRNQQELETVWIIAQISYYQARGLSMEPRAPTAVPRTGWGGVKNILGGALRMDGA